MSKKKAKIPKSSRFITALGFQETEIRQLIRRRRRQILVHSCLYYQLDASLVSDPIFDSWCKELTKLQEQYPKISAHVEYAREFKGFTGVTGFNLPYGNPEITTTAMRLLQYRKEEEIEQPTKKQLFIPFIRRTT